MTPEFLALQRAVAGRYSLVRELGRGGMGVVFLARDVALDRPVAIKLLPPELARLPRSRNNFVREARTAAGLAHPHIVPIHAVEAHDDLVFFVMSYVDGETLGARIARVGRLPVGDVTRVMREIAWALGHAHARGIVHRDVKPDNIILERDTDRAMVTDFGIAAAMGAATDEAVVGTPRFMSPEQARGGAVDGRSDLYALGCVAWTAAAGHSPFESTTAAGFLTQHLASPVPSLRAARPTVPLALATAIEGCLAKLPAERPSSAEALAVELRRSESAAVDGPPALRAFARELTGACSEASTALTLLGVIVVLFAFTRLWPYEGIFEGFGRMVALYYYVAASAGVIGLAGIRFGQLAGRARALARAGFSFASMRPMLAAEEAATQDAFADAGERPSVARSTAIVAASVVATTVAVAASGSESTVVSFTGLTASLAIPTLALRHLYRRLDGAGRSWSRTVRHALGRAAFAIGSLRVRPAGATPFAGEPTVVALGDAVGALYQALAADERRALAGVPELVERLERDATALRARRHPGDEDRYVSAVAAMESLRLDLMRLRVPGADRREITGELTREIDRVRRIGDEIDALLRPASEVRIGVRPPTLTPNPDPQP